MHDYFKLEKNRRNAFNIYFTKLFATCILSLDPAVVLRSTADREVPGSHPTLA